MKGEFIESRAEMEKFLQQMDLGYLCLSRDGEAYPVPINYAYCDGTILVHCAHEGKKIDCIGANPRVSFVVAYQSERVGPHAIGQSCHVPCESVICYGTARVIEDLDERAEKLNAFNRRFRPDTDDLPLERVRGCACIEITLDEMTGRRENAGELTCWRWRF